METFCFCFIVSFVSKRLLYLISKLILTYKLFSASLWSTLCHQSKMGSEMPSSTQICNNVHWNDLINMKMVLLMYGVENRSIHRVWPGCNFEVSCSCTKVPAANIKTSPWDAQHCKTTQKLAWAGMQGHWKLENLQC